MRLLVLGFLALSACETTRILPAGVTGNAAFVSVSNVWNAGDALPYATKHCAQYGKVPKLTHSEGYTVNFDCI